MLLFLGPLEIGEIMNDLPQRLHHGPSVESRQKTVLESLSVSLKRKGIQAAPRKESRLSPASAPPQPRLSPP